jgi:hypothetical protein
MSLNKFTDAVVIKDWMNVGCNSINCNTIDATTIDIETIDVTTIVSNNIITQQLSVINDASIGQFANVGELNVIGVLNADIAYFHGVRQADRVSEPRVKTMLSIPTDTVAIQQVISPYVAYTDDPAIKTITAIPTLVLPNAGGLSPQSSLTLTLAEGDCYEFIAYLKNGPTELITPTTFYCLLDDIVNLSYITNFSVAKLGANQPLKLSCKFSITGAGTPTATVFSAFECVSTYAGITTPFETKLSTYYFNTAPLINPSNFSLKLSNTTTFDITLQSASINCIYSKNVPLSVV